MENEKFQNLILQQFEKISARFDSLDKNQNELFNRFSALEKSQQQIAIRIENELEHRLRALYEAREVQSDINQQILNVLNRIENKIDVLQVETSHVRKVR